jgi:hypothetical protein
VHVATGAQNKIKFEGSFELTPFFQGDVDALRRVSPRFVAMLFISSAWIATVWWLTNDVPETRSLYPFALGAIVLVEMTVHVGHLRNWFVFTHGTAWGMEGRLEYRRRYVLLASVSELFAFAALYGVLWAVTGSPFVPGGGVACATLSLRHYLLARKHKAARA